MNVDHSMPFAAEMASPASIESRENYKENLDFYHRNDYTYIPMPLDGVYFNVEEETFGEIEQEMYILEDLSLRNAIEHLQDYPFLLVDYTSGIHINKKGEVVQAFDSDEDLEYLGGPEEAVKKRPEIKDEIIKACEERYFYLIIVLADVNRRVVKDVLYPVLAELESRLASEIQQVDYTPKQLYPDLRSDTIGRREKDKIAGVQMHIAEYMTLSEMMTVVGKSEVFRENFGYSSRSQFKKDLGGLVPLRNKVMHASRTLVHNRSDLEQLIDRILRAESAIETHGGTVIKGTYKKTPKGWMISDKH